MKDFIRHGELHSGLEADTTYFYKVGQEGNYSETKSFQTAKTGEDIIVAFLWRYTRCLYKVPKYN